MYYGKSLLHTLHKYNVKTKKNMMYITHTKDFFYQTLVAS